MSAAAPAKVRLAARRLREHVVDAVAALGVLAEFDPSSRELAEARRLLAVYAFAGGWRRPRREPRAQRRRRGR